MIFYILMVGFLLITIEMDQVLDKSILKTSEELLCELGNSSNFLSLSNQWFLFF